MSEKEETIKKMFEASTNIGLNFVDVGTEMPSIFESYPFLSVNLKPQAIVHFINERHINYFLIQLDNLVQIHVGPYRSYETPIREVNQDVPFFPHQQMKKAMGQIITFYDSIENFSFRNFIFSPAENFLLNEAAFLGEVGKVPAYSEDGHQQYQKVLEALRMGNAQMAKNAIEGITDRIMKEDKTFWQQMLRNLNFQFHLILLEEGVLPAIVKTLYEKNEGLLLEHREDSSFLEDGLLLVNAYIRMGNKFKTKHYSLHVSKAIHYIQQNLSNEISLNAFAEKENLYPQYLSKLFRKETGQTFTEYVHNLRINTAILLMRVTTRKLNEIAFETGFNDANYFSRIFKKHTGMTPQEFRKKTSF